MSLPAVKVEIDADPSSAGWFTFETSPLDGADVLAPSVRYVAISGVIGVSTHRGRAGDEQACDVGTATITLDGWDGNYDPDNAAGRYVRNGKQLLRQGMLVRISVTISGVDHVIFTGILQSTSATYTWDPTMTWTCVDLLARMGSTSFPPSLLAERAGDTSHQRIDWLLGTDAAYADRIVTVGGKTLVGTQGGGTLLSNVENVARSEWGRVYADRSNRLVVTYHVNEYAKTTNVVISDSATDTGPDVYGDIYADIYPGLGVVSPDSLTVQPGIQGIVNRAIVNRAIDSAAFTSEATLSRDLYGPHTLTADVLLANDAEAQQLADYLASHRGTPASRVTSVTSEMFGHTDTALTSVADLDLGDWVLVERTTADGRRLSWQVSAEGIDHALSPTGWSMTLATSPLDLASLSGGAGWFALDTSALDGVDTLASF